MTVLLAVTTLPIVVSSAAKEARLLFLNASDIVTATTWHLLRYCQSLLDACILYTPAFRIVPFQATARTGEVSTR